MDYRERDPLYEIFKKKYPLLRPVRDIPNKKGVKIFVMDKNEIFYPTEVYIRNGTYHIKFDFSKVVGFIFNKDKNLF